VIEMAVEVVVCRLLREALGVLACSHLGQRVKVRVRIAGDSLG